MFSSITKMFVDAKIRLRREETGATAVEYGLIVGFIALAIIAGVTLFGGALNQMFIDMTADLP